MGTNTSSTIDINGRKYDAVSGSYLGGTPSQPRFVDGFRPAAKKPAVLRAGTHHVPAHKPSASKTLMRSAVKKPSVQSSEVIKAQTRTDILARTPNQVVAPKVSYNSVNPARQKKAVQMVQSPAVSHYGAAIDVRPTPVNYATHKTQPLEKAIESLRAAHFQGAGRQNIAGVSAQVTTASNQVSAPAKQPDIFEQALARATSHTQTFDGPAPKRRGARIGFLATAAVSLLVLIGAVAYFNVPQLSLKLAATRAGIPAKLPTYSPAGYTFGTVSYGPGKVTISYKQGNNQAFDITQRESNWDSQALLSNFVSNANKAYRTYERAGRTIYFFGDNTATWVSGGVWYTVSGNNSLTTNQLLDLASSI